MLDTTTFQPLTHDEAVQEVYRLTPQIREYDEFMYLGVRWLPYTMFFHHGNYRSAVINTDSLGFRYSSSDRGFYSVADLPTDRPINLLVGGSTALGTGATTDGGTISSRLSAHTNETWLNFSGRGYNAVQEVLLFLMHQQRFTHINNVVVLSGINTLTLEGIPDRLATDHGRYYYSFEYTHYMEKYNEDLKRRQNTYASDLDGRQKGMIGKYADFIRSKLGKDNPADVLITDEDTDTEDRVKRAAGVITNSMFQWQQLLAPFGARLSFVLQPMSYWVKERFTQEELAIFHAIDSCPNNFWRLFGKILDPQIHKPFASEISLGCHQRGIPFWDMNDLLRDSHLCHKNIFVDRVHFNDVGYDEVARIVSDVVLS
ncbi:G-D-S-L family lipolytic protein [Paraburkholderia fungorum]|uniref:lipase n=1 Tax=Paraburkholderia fungorum TaxID=134537 RepID=UPI00048717AC|nr:lipase [Paraburkholderia fungorum]PNE59689.1 G-D-S-L family lipolytic protein [Paraburkholderia fungorum]